MATQPQDPIYFRNLSNHANLAPGDFLPGDRAGVTTDFTVIAASETEAGLVRIATTAEVDSGTQNVAVDAAELRRRLDALAPSLPQVNPLFPRIIGAVPTVDTDGSVYWKIPIGGGGGGGGGLTQPQVTQIVNGIINSGGYQTSAQVTQAINTAIGNIDGVEDITYSQANNRLTISYFDSRANRDIDLVTGLTQAAVDARVKSADNAATESARGNIQLASQAETNSGTTSDKAVTPATLSDRTATTTRVGIIELATSSEAITGTDGTKAITPETLTAWEAAQQARGGGSAGVVNASTTQRGIIEIATETEADTGTDTSTAMTPALVQRRIAAISIPDVSNFLTEAQIDDRVKSPDNAASMIARGNIELANQTEADAGTDNVKAMTPALVQRRIAAINIPAAPGNASFTTRGIIEIATNDETRTGTDSSRAVTPAGLVSAIQGAGLVRSSVDTRATSVVNDRIDNAPLPSSGGSTRNAPSIALVVAGLAGKQGTLSAAQTVVTGGTTGQLLARAAAGGTEWVDAPSGGGGTTYTLPQATTTVLGGVRLADISSFNAGALLEADRPRVVTLEDFREVFGVSNTGGAVAQPSLVRATTTKEGLVRIATAIATDNAQNNVAVPTVAQVRTALAGKEDTLANAVRVATGGTSGQLLSRAAGGGTSWIDAPSGGGNGGSTSGGLTKTDLYVNPSAATQAPLSHITFNQSFKDFDLLYIQAQDTTTRDIGFSFADPAEITVGTTDTGSNEVGVFVDNAQTARIFLRFETNTRAEITHSTTFRIVKIVGLNFAAGSGGGGTGATTFAALTDTPTAASLRANSGEHLVVNQTGDAIVTQSNSAAVRDGVQTAGVGQTAVDNRVTTIGDARYSHAGGTQISNALHQWDTHLSTIHTAGDTVYHGGFNRAWELTITDRANRTGTFAGDDDGLTFSGGNISGETSKQYGIWGFRAAATVSTPGQTLVQWTGVDAGGSAVGRIWISTAGAGANVRRLQIHNPSDPTQATLVTSAANSAGFLFGTTNSATFANQILLEVLKRRPNTPSDDGIEFLPTVIRADGTVVQCNNIPFTSGWRAFNTSRIHLFETSGTILIDRVKLAVHNGYESHAAVAAQVAAPNHNAPVAWATRTTGTGSDTQAYNGDFDFLGRLKSQDADGVLQLVVGDNDARLPRDPKNATDGQLVGVSGGALVYVNAPTGGGGGTTSAATTEAAGIVELATAAETSTGTDSNRAVTPAGVRAAFRATQNAATGSSRGAVQLNQGTLNVTTPSLNSDNTVPTDRTVAEAIMSNLGGSSIVAVGNYIQDAFNTAAANSSTGNSGLWLCTRGSGVSLPITAFRAGQQLLPESGGNVTVPVGGFCRIWGETVQTRNLSYLGRLDGAVVPPP